MAQHNSSGSTGRTRFLFYVVGGFELVLVGLGLAEGHWLQAFSYAAVAFVFFLSPRTARQHMHIGWLRGRSAMAQSMIEATARGMSPQAFMTAELERDLINGPFADPTGRRNRKMRRVSL